MKKIYFIILILSCLSCSKFLEEVPQNKLRPSTTSDYDQLLNNAYITEQIMPFVDMASDDVILKAEDHVMPDQDPSDFMVSAYMWDNTHETTMTSGDKAFEKFYESIFYCNVVIENIQNATGDALDLASVQKTKNNIEGEARVLRAYSYFYLVNLYAAPYDPETAETTPGMPINDLTSAPFQSYRRSSLAQVYKRIVDDLELGIDLMEKNQIGEKSKFKFDVPAAKVLLSRVYLYMHNYEKTIEVASDAIKTNSVLFNLHDMGEVLNDSNNEGSSWSDKTIPGEDYLGVTNPNVLFVNGITEIMPMMSYWPFTTTFSVNPDLAACYEENDVRRFYFMYTYNRDTYAGYRSKLSYAKNRNKGVIISATISAGYTRTIRNEETYLNLAEAYAMNDDNTNALKYLNDLRREKFRNGKYEELQPSDFNDMQSLVDFILLERRRELCFEGHRWFDLRRTTRPAMKRLGYDNREAVLEKDDLKYTFQIPQRELDINPEIGINPR